MPCAKLLEYLRKNHVDFELKEHPSAYAAQDVAYKSGVPARLFAKTVMVRLDGAMAMAVLPADSRIDFHLLRECARADTIALATEEEFAALFPDCELGAMPPFGNLWGMPVYIAGSLLRTDLIAFNAGSHREVITMPFWQFEKLAEPRIGYFTYRRLREKESMA